MKNNLMFFVVGIVFALLFGSCNNPNKSSDKDVLKNDSSLKRISDEDVFHDLKDLVCTLIGLEFFKKVL